MGSTGLVVVALPAEDDYVRKISSEKEAHLTLLYLDEETLLEGSRLDQVVEYVGFASTLISPFGLTVEDRGELGDKNADVLFFNKKWCDEIQTFRKHLLSNDLVAGAYLSIEQFPGWVPHLTLGYPDNPAKKDTREYPGIQYVRFDRIAVWTGDYSGPTFKLKHKDEMEESPAVAHSHDITERVLFHYGVKGMKWGVRRDRGHEGERAKTTKIAKLDRKFERNSQSFKTTIEIHNRAAELTNKNDIDRINNKPQYKNADFSKDTPLRRKYYDEHQKAFLKNLDKAADEFGTNASGTKKYSIFERPDGGWDVELKDVSHADDDTISVKVDYDDQGHILSLKVVENEEELSHYGIKGMRWGVRRSDAQLAKAASSSQADPLPPPKPVKVSDDFKSAAAAQMKINEGGTKTLTNQELQGLLTRMNLERQYRMMVAPPQAQQKSVLDQGHAHVKKALALGKTYEEARKFAASPTGQAVKTGVKTAVAATAAYFTGGTSAAVAAGAGVVIRRVTR